MATLDKTAWEILNATADDQENLEQIYRAICLDFSAPGYEERDRGAYYLRPAPGAPLLEELGDRICQLAEAGLLQAHLQGTEHLADLGDRSYVWRAWFSMTSRGRELWAASEHTALV
jgi:hypothetical protein